MSSETIQVRRGDLFEVALREPPATGHRWRLVRMPPQVTLERERYEAPGPGGPLGSAGRRVATLRATASGRYRVQFELSRGGKGKPADEHWVEVDAV
jgi:predicted secreted protein